MTDMTPEQMLDRLENVADSAFLDVAAEMAAGIRNALSRPAVPAIAPLRWQATPATPNIYASLVAITPVGSYSIINNNGHIALLTPNDKGRVESVEQGKAQATAHYESLVRSMLTASPTPAPAVPEGWISVTDKLPTEDDYGEHDDVLVRYRYTDEPGRPWNVGESHHDPEDEYNGGWCFGSCKYAEVSHWMPKSALLTAAPTAEESSGDTGHIDTGDVVRWAEGIARLENTDLQPPEPTLSIALAILVAAHRPESAEGDSQ